MGLLRLCLLFALMLDGSDMKISTKANSPTPLRLVEFWLSSDFFTGRVGKEVVRTLNVAI